MRYYRFMFQWLILMALASTMALAVNQPPTFSLPSGKPAQAGDFWIETTAGQKSWVGVASSADGSRLAAVAAGEFVYTSADSGATWVPRLSDTPRAWACITSSGDGLKLAAAVDGGDLYTSTDGGATWTSHDTSGSHNWESIASSSDGTKLAAVEWIGNVWMSMDAGATWNSTTLPSAAWRSIAASADGSKWIAAVAGGYVYTSSDSGVTWMAHLTDHIRGWAGVISSADGMSLAAVAASAPMADSQIFVSADGGVTWSSREPAPLEWYAIAGSSDGKRLFASSLDGTPYASADGGVTWRQSVFGSVFTLNFVASSADGTQVIGGNDSLFMSVSTPEVSVLSDGNPYSQTHFATNISPGPPSEAAQVVTFSVSSSSNQLFASPPSIDGSGTLAFTPAPHVSGVAWVNVQAKDDGDAAIGGVAYSPYQTFKIRVTPLEGPRDIVLSNIDLFENGVAGTVVGSLSATNSNPAASHEFSLVNGLGNTDNGKFSISGNALTLTGQVLSSGQYFNNQLSIRVRATDSGGLFLEKVIYIPITQVNNAPVFTLAKPSIPITGAPGSVAIGGIVTSVYSGDFSLPRQTVTFTVTNDHNEFFSALPAIDGDGTLTFTLIGHITSPITVTVIAKDDGGTLHGGVDTSAPQTFTLTGNYAPTDITITHGVVPENNIFIIHAGTLTAIDPDVGDTAHFDLVGGAGSADNSLFELADNILNFRGMADFEDQASYSVRVRVTDAAGASFEKSFIIHVIDANDRPSFALPIGAAGRYWTERLGDRVQYWADVASSANGVRLAGVPNFGHLYLSSDGGTTWHERLAEEDRYWTGIASSADGSTLAATTARPSNSTPVSIYISANFGVTWTERLTTSDHDWQGVAVSSDGTKMAAVANDNIVHTSNDGGVTWTDRSPASVESFTHIAASADGNKLVVTGNGLYTSADFGITWTQRLSGVSRSWTHVASSADGTRLFVVGRVAGTLTSQLYRSTDSGAIWTVVPDSVQMADVLWDAIACSADGLKVAAIRDDGGCYTSDDGGATWALQSRLRYTFARAMSSSADGSKLAVAGPVLYTSDSTPLVSALLNSSAYSQTGFVANISPGPATDAGQVVSFEVINDTPTMFIAQPAIDASGTLTFTPAPGVAGTATVTVVAHDNGGTANGGMDTSAPQYFFIKIVGATLAVEAPSGSPLADGSTFDFGGRGVGGVGASRIFYIRNTGNGDITGLALTLDGPNASEFTMSPLTVTNLPVGSSTNFSVVFKPTANGARTAAIHLASSVPGPTNPLDVTLTGTGLNPIYAAWRDSHFGATVSKVSDNEDFNGDGVPNLLEFAFGTSPESGGAAGRKPLKYTGPLTGGGTMVQAGQPILVFNGTTPCGLFVRRKDFATSGLVYAAQFSVDMTSWQTSATPPMVLADDGTFQVVCVPYPILGGGQQARYFRVDVSLAP